MTKTEAIPGELVRDLKLGIRGLIFERVRVINSTDWIEGCGKYTRDLLVLVIHIHRPALRD